MSNDNTISTDTKQVKCTDCLLSSKCNRYSDSKIGNTVIIDMNVYKSVTGCCNGIPKDINQGR